MFDQNNSSNSPVSDQPNIDPKKDRLDKKFNLRKEFWEKVGSLSPDVLTPLINPAFAGQPIWPNFSERFLIIKADKTLIIASDGLSDDFRNNPEPNDGLGIELYVETDAPEIVNMPIDQLKSSWFFQLLKQAVLNALESNAYQNAAFKYKTFSSEFYDVNVPKNFLNEQNRVGVLIGMESEKVPSKLSYENSEILMLSVTLLNLEDLNHIVQNGSVGREEITKKLIASGKKNLSRMN